VQFSPSYRKHVWLGDGPTEATFNDSGAGIDGSGSSMFVSDGLRLYCKLMILTADPGLAAEILANTAPVWPTRQIETDLILPGVTTDRSM
jgi:hypothetical protein